MLPLMLMLHRSLKSRRCAPCPGRPADDAQDLDEGDFPDEMED